MSNDGVHEINGVAYRFNVDTNEFLHTPHTIICWVNGSSVGSPESII